MRTQDNLGTTIIKKGREDRTWSREHLAEICGNTLCGRADAYMVTPEKVL